MPHWQREHRPHGGHEREHACEKQDAAEEQAKEIQVTDSAVHGATASPGDPRVDAALAGLDELDGLDLPAQLEVFTDLQDRLAQILDTPDKPVSTDLSHRRPGRERLSTRARRRARRRGAPADVLTPPCPAVSGSMPSWSAAAWRVVGACEPARTDGRVSVAGWTPANPRPVSPRTPGRGRPRSDAPGYASRGGHKLAGALQVSARRARRAGRLALDAEPPPEASPMCCCGRGAAG